MNKRLEDKIAMLAFGDLPEAEAAEVRAVAERDPEAQRVLRAYESMRTDLKSMGESVPADQLSKERLQDAILKQGLKPKPDSQRRWLAWVMAPATLTVLFAVVLALQSDRSADPVSVTKAEPQQESVVPELGDEPEADPAEAASALKMGASEPTESMAAQAETQTAPVATVKDSGESKPVKATAPKKRSTTRVARNDKPATQKASPPAVDQPREMALAAVDGAPSEAPKVILIQNETDDLTGALRAVEVEAYSGVLIGS